MNKNLPLLLTILSLGLASASQAAIDPFQIICKSGDELYELHYQVSHQGKPSAYTNHRAPMDGGGQHIAIAPVLSLTEEWVVIRNGKYGFDKMDLFDTPASAEPQNLGYRAYNISDSVALVRIECSGDECGLSYQDKTPAPAAGPFKCTRTVKLPLKAT